MIIHSIIRQRRGEKVVSEIIKETECIVISYTNSLINKYKENKIMRDDYVHVLLFFLK